MKPGQFAGQLRINRVEDRLRPTPAAHIQQRRAAGRRRISMTRSPVSQKFQVVVWQQHGGEPRKILRSCFFSQRIFDAVKAGQHGVAQGFDGFLLGRRRSP